MEIKLHSGEQLQTRPLLFDITDKGKFIGRAEVDMPISEWREARKQAYVIAYQMKLNRRTQ